MEFKLLFRTLVFFLFLNSINSQQKCNFKSTFVLFQTMRNYILSLNFIFSGFIVIVQILFSIIVFVPLVLCRLHIYFLFFALHIWQLRLLLGIMIFQSIVSTPCQSYCAISVASHIGSHDIISGGAMRSWPWLRCICKC